MIEVSTTEFEFSHGKKPRGEGCWAFFVDQIQEPILITGSFAQAKRVALEYAKARGARRIAVGS